MGDQEVGQTARLPVLSSGMKKIGRLGRCDSPICGVLGAMRL